MLKRDRLQPRVPGEGGVRVGGLPPGAAIEQVLADFQVMQDQAWAFWELTANIFRSIGVGVDPTLNAYCTIYRYYCLSRRTEYDVASRQLKIFLGLVETHPNCPSTVTPF